MKLRHSQKVHEATSKYPGRYAMNCVQLRLAFGGKPELVATDGRILAVVPVELTGTSDPNDGFEGGELIARDTFVELMKGRKTEERSLIRNVHKDIIGRRGELSLKARLGEGDFPKVDQLVPEERDDDITFTFDVEFLVRIAKATGAEAITLRIPSKMPDEPGHVTPPHETVDWDRQVATPVKVIARGVGADNYRPNGAFGVIMPITVER